MFVSSPPSVSKSRSLRFVPFCRCGDRFGAELVDIDMMLSAGDAAPDCDLPCDAEIFDCVLAVDGRMLGGRIECFLVGKPAPGRGRPAIE